MRHLLIYLVLVGTPLLLLVGVLNLGERITPLPSLDGEWMFETMNEDVGCRGSLASGSVFVISQSGLTSELRVPGSSLTGSLRLHDDGLSGTLRFPDEVGCARDAVTLSLRLAGEDSLFPDRMTGSLAGEGCVSCAGGDVTLTRRAAAVRVGAGR